MDLNLLFLLEISYYSFLACIKINLKLWDDAHHSQFGKVFHFISLGKFNIQVLLSGGQNEPPLSLKADSIPHNLSDSSIQPIRKDPHVGWIHCLQKKCISQIWYCTWYIFYEHHWASVVQIPKTVWINSIKTNSLKML